MNILRTSKLISSNQQLIIESVKTFCKNELAPIARKNYRNEYFNKEIYKEFGKAGLLGSTIQGYGCLGESYKTYGLIAKEIEKVDSGFRSMVSVQSSLVMYPIYKYANESIGGFHPPYPLAPRFARGISSPLPPAPRFAIEMGSLRSPFVERRGLGEPLGSPLYIGRNE